MLTENSEARRLIATGPHHSRADRGRGKHGGSPTYGNPGGPHQNRGVRAAIGTAAVGMRALRLHGRGAIRRLEFLGWPHWNIYCRSQFLSCGFLVWPSLFELFHLTLITAVRREQGLPASFPARPAHLETCPLASSVSANVGSAAYAFWMPELHVDRRLSFATHAPVSGW